MQEVKKQRTAARARVTHASTWLSALLDEESPSVSAVDDGINQLDSRISDLDEVQAKLELELDED